MRYIIDIGDGYTKIYNERGPYNSFIEASVIPNCVYISDTDDIIYGTEAYNKRDGINKLIFFPSLIGKSYSEMIMDKFCKRIYEKNKIVRYDNQIGFECNTRVYTLNMVCKMYINYIMSLLVDVSDVIIITHHKEYMETLVSGVRVIYDGEYRYRDIIYPIIERMESYYYEKYDILSGVDIYGEMENILKNEYYVLNINDMFIQNIYRDKLLNKIGVSLPEYDIYNNCKRYIGKSEDKSSNKVENREILRSIGICTIGDIYVPIISRGNIYPIEKSIDFLNSDDCNELEIRVYIGENKFCEENEYIGEIKINFEQYIRRGTKRIRVKMNIDESLKLKVMVNEKSVMIDISKLNYAEEISVESEIKRIIDSERVSPLLESLELKYLVNNYKKQKLSVEKQEYLKCAEYIINNYEEYGLTDIQLFTNEFKMKMNTC